MRLEIRAVSPNEAEDFRALRLRGLEESPEAFGTAYEEYVTQPIEDIAARLIPTTAPYGSVVIGAYLDGTLVGVAGCVQQSRVKTRHAATIWGMYVAPEARGHGVGRQLLERAIAEAQTWPGVERVTITVVERATAARALYIGAGFQPFGREVDALRQNGVSDTMEYLALRLFTP